VLHYLISTNTDNKLYYYVCSSLGCTHLEHYSEFLFTKLIILIKLTRLHPCNEVFADNLTHTDYQARARHANVAWEIQPHFGECWIAMCTQHNWTSVYTSSIRSRRSNLLNGQHNLELRPANQSCMGYDKLFRFEHA
jgi:hypothetical protein